MKLFLIILSILFGTLTVGTLILFLQYFANNYFFLKNCRKEKGTIIRWIPVSSSHSAKASWWAAGNDWSPVIEYYDVSVGAIQEHEAVLPRKCTLQEHSSDEVVEIEYYGKHVRITDKRFVDNNIYSGYYFFLLFALSLILCGVTTLIYYMI